MFYNLLSKPDFLFNNGKDIVAVISNEKIIDVKNMVNGEKICLSAKEYMKKREVLAIMAKSIYDIKEPVQMTGEELFSKYYAKVNNKNSQYTRINGSLQENTFKIKSRKTAKM